MPRTSPPRDAHDASLDKHVRAGTKWMWQLFLAGMGAYLLLACFGAGIELYRGQYTPLVAVPRAFGIAFVVSTPLVVPLFFFWRINRNNLRTLLTKGHRIAGRVTRVGYVGTGAKKTPKVDVEFVSNGPAPKVTTIISPDAAPLVSGQEVAVWVAPGSANVAVEWGPDCLAVGTAR